MILMLLLGMVCTLTFFAMAGAMLSRNKLTLVTNLGASLLGSVIILVLVFLVRTSPL